MHITVESIQQFNRYFYQPTYHPLVSVGRLQNADLSLLFCHWSWGVLDIMPTFLRT